MSYPASNPYPTDTIHPTIQHGPLHPKLLIIHHNISPAHRGTCALCSLTHNCQLPHLPASALVATTTPILGSQQITKYHRRPTYHLAKMRVTACGHQFHEACLLSWLEEGMHEAMGCGATKGVPVEMRMGVEAATCGVCTSVQSLVREAGAGPLELEKLVTVIRVGMM
ncbi:hypothetical protein E8E13_004664 [Curvularia kusanoi]|uniref:Zinc finger C3HC4 RING-type domain-containing protein n=1 Tax=Curvularia kusanoi TaxID=90978 RepID=A0A9P4WA72_CURKU|nr:hypothetical protein E8E13_004664 [Curvularia kusanoi]